MMPDSTTTTTNNVGNPYQNATGYQYPDYITGPSADLAGFMQDYYQSMINPETGMVGGYQGRLTAGINPLQRQALNLAPEAVGAWGDQFNKGLNYTNQAATRFNNLGRYNPAELQRHLNPYTGGVLDEIARRGNENLMENVMPNVNSTFTGNGQFGSTRNGTFLNNAIRNNQREILGTQANALNQAYNQASQDYLGWNNAGQSAATGFGTMGNQLSQQALTGGQQNWNDLTNAFNLGGANRAINQEGLTSQYNNWLNSWKQPLDAMSSMGGVLAQLKSGITPNSMTANATFSDPNAALYGVLAQILSGAAGTPTTTPTNSGSMMPVFSDGTGGYSQGALPQGFANPAPSVTTGTAGFASANTSQSPFAIAAPVPGEIPRAY